jgi:hypothetical protein
MCEEFDLFGAEFDGCAFGLKADDCTPVKKSWRVSSNMPLLFVAVNSGTCTCTCEHAPCAGSNAKTTESYTLKLALTVSTWPGIAPWE